MTNDSLDPTTGRPVHAGENGLAPGDHNVRPGDYSDAAGATTGTPGWAQPTTDEPPGAAFSPSGSDHQPSHSSQASDPAQGVTEKAKNVAGQAADEAAAVKDTAVEKAAQVKDVAVERGTDVANVAKEEFTRLTGDARTQLQTLWGQTSDQLRDQAATGKQQLADLLHALSAELGEMASKSTQDGPLTALAKQASHQGGQLSHWLSESDPSDVLVEIRRFARRRPFVFLAGAGIAGVLVGRLSRGLMAASDGPQPTRSSGYSDQPPDYDPAGGGTPTVPGDPYVAASTDLGGTLR